jgi:hypothetical protein
MALRTVPWLTLNRVARSISLGMAALGFHSPDCRLCSMSTLICWYNGLNAGAGDAVPPASAALGPAKSVDEGGKWAMKTLKKSAWSQTQKFC